MRNAEITIVMWPEPDEELYGRLFTAVADAAHDLAPEGYEVDVSARPCMSVRPTRQTCARCIRISPYDFYSPIWKEIAGRWSDDILCVMCFAILGDERGLRWEEGMTITPCSLVSHNDL